MSDIAMHVELRQKVIAELKKAGHAEGCIYVVGGSDIPRYNTDVGYVFRQESNFLYLTGVEEPDFAAIIDVATAKFTLLAPKLPEEYAVWLGGIPTLDEIKAKYGADEVAYTESRDKVLLQAKPKTVFILPILVDKLSLKDFTVDDVELKKAIDEARVFKTDMELDLMRKVGKICSDAHIVLMKHTYPGMYEDEAEAVFFKECRKYGCKHLAYGAIMAGGNRSATLHYIPNDAEITDGFMFLTDAGPELKGYASDITRTYPANGKFTEKQKLIYNMVLKMQLAVMNAMKPGVEWTDMHRLAQKVCCEEMLKAGFMKGTVDELMANHVSATFFPHGLGHLMGLDVHDVGGFPGDRVKLPDPGIQNLRANRVMEKGMVFTAEPGIYFIEILLKKAENDPVLSKYINFEKVNEFRDFGGVRIEDDLIITETGIENMTFVPRTIEDIEKAMAK